MVQPADMPLPLMMRKMLLMLMLLFLLTWLLLRFCQPQCCFLCPCCLCPSFLVWGTKPFAKLWHRKKPKDLTLLPAKTDLLWWPVPAWPSAEWAMVEPIAQLNHRVSMQEQRAWFQHVAPHLSRFFSEHAGVYALDPNPWFEAGLWCHNAHWCLSSSVHIWSRAVRSTIPSWFCGILCWWYAQWNWQLQWTECLLEAYPECGSSPPAISFQVPNNPNGKSFPNHVDIQIEFALKSHQVHLDWNPKADSQHLIATLFCCDVVSGNHNYHNWQINKHKHQLD